MTVTQTKALLTPFVKRETENLPIQSLFKAADNEIEPFHNADEIEYHVQNTSRNLAPAVRHASADYLLYDLDEFTIKKTKPAVFKLGIKISANELIRGIDLGNTEYASKKITERLQTKVAPAITDVVNKYDRSIEHYGCQLLRSGSVSLTGEDGEVFTEDFEAPSNHFVNASIAWTSPATAKPFDDINGLANELVVDAMGPVQRGFVNGVGFVDMANTDQFKAGVSKEYTGQIFRLREDLEPIYPRLGGGAIFKGVLQVGAEHMIDLYVINGWYNALGTGTVTRYIHDDEFIVTCDGPLVKTYGGIMKFGTDRDAVALLKTGAGGASGRLSIPERGFDLSYNMWLSESKEVFNFGIGTRPALIPKAKNIFGRIRTKGF